MKKKKILLLVSKPQTYKQTKKQTKTKPCHITTGKNFLKFPLYSLFQSTNAFTILRKFH